LQQGLKVLDGIYDLLRVSEEERLRYRERARYFAQNGAVAANRALQIIGADATSRPQFSYNAGQVVRPATKLPQSEAPSHRLFQSCVIHHLPH
jgi:hypothetical protein